MLLAPFVVTTTVDNGNNTSPTPGSLRAAIIAADAQAGSSEIDFSISGSGPQTIKPPTALPNVTEPVFINGASQPGYAGTPLIILDGSLAPTGTEGLHYATGSGGGKISALDIVNFNGNAIELSSSGNTITGCYIGTDTSSDTGLGNGATGVVIDNGASGNMIGGTSPAAANVIASSSYDGIDISGSGTTGNVVEGNFIGTDASSDTGLGNGAGVSIFGGASGNTIGGTSAAAANVIASNRADGVYISDSGTTGNVVEGNFIGTDASSHTGLGNGYGGLSISGGASGNTIGGTTAGAANVIVSSVVSGADGVYISDSGTTGNVVEGNFIGTDASSHTGLGNGGYGVAIVGGASGNTIGGTSPTAADVIANNSFDGLFFFGSGTTGNVVEGNFIGTDASSHTGLGNGGDGVDIVDDASGNTIGGTSPAAANVIANNGGDGIFLGDSGTTGNVVEGNFIGTDASSHTGLGNSGDAVDIVGDASGNTIGGTVAGAANIIASNSSGIDLGGSGTTGNLVQGNYIGTNATGATGLGNSGDGVDIVGGASGNTIGGTVAGAANVIASNSSGIDLGGSGTTGNVVEGNLIGTDASSDTGLGNVNGGVAISGGASGNTIGGTSAAAANVIASNGGDGIFIGGSGTMGNVVEGNFIGTDASSHTGLGNYAGMAIANGASGNTIGGTSAAAANVIAASAADGMYVSNSGTTGNVIEGNFIGTDASSHTGLGNGFGGLSISGGASGNTIGGTTAGAANVIVSSVVSGADGVFLGDSGTTGNVIEGNFIGTDASSHTGLGNGGYGVAIVGGASGNTIGGTSPTAADVIANNSFDGLFLFGTGTTGNVVEGNFIGTDANSHTGLGNGGDGVGIVDGASGNTIGGTASGAGNVIAFNQKGVVIGDSTTDTATGDAILGNSIFSNTQLGIDLANDGVTPNDSSGHTGPNLFQDFPVLTFAATIKGTVQGPANSMVRVEIFANAAADPSGHGQGQTFLGFVAVTTDPSGNGTFTFTPTSRIAPGQFLSATATDANGNTSEFSQHLPVVADMTSQIRVRVSGPNFNRFTGVYTETLTLTNTGSTSIAAPLQIVLTGLTPGVTLTDATGTTPDDNPYITTNTTLAAGASITFTLTFKKSSFSLYINYTPNFYSGNFTL